MKEYLKSELKHLPFTIVLFVLLYGITAFATGTTLFASSEVSYDNTTTGIQSNKVQGAIDELYACASNYAAYNTRLTNTENKIGTGSLTTTSNTLIGGVNELNSKLTTEAVTITKGTNVASHGVSCLRIGNVIMLNGWFTTNSTAPSAQEALFSGLPTAARETYFIIRDTSNNSVRGAYMAQSSNQFKAVAALSANTSYHISSVYVR